jgi:hypothetical protein
MTTRLPLYLVLPLCLLAADQPWKSRQIAEWTEDDARALLTESPWIKTFTPEMKQAPGRSMTHSVNPGGVNVGGVNVGVPGMGRVSRRGMGNADNAPSAEPPRLTLRWESAPYHSVRRTESAR